MSQGASVAGRRFDVGQPEGAVGAPERDTSRSSKKCFLWTSFDSHGDCLIHHKSKESVFPALRLRTFETRKEADDVLSIKFDS